MTGSTHRALTGSVGPAPRAPARRRGDGMLWAQLASLLTLALCGWALYLTQPYRLVLTLVLLLVLLPFAAMLPDRFRP